MPIVLTIGMWCEWGMGWNGEDKHVMHRAGDEGSDWSVYVLRNMRMGKKEGMGETVLLSLSIFNHQLMAPWEQHQSHRCLLCFCSSEISTLGWIPIYCACIKSHHIASHSSPSSPLPCTICQGDWKQTSVMRSGGELWSSVLDLPVFETSSLNTNWAQTSQFRLGTGQH